MKKISLPQKNITKILHPKEYQNYNQVINTNHFTEIKKKFLLLKIKKKQESEMESFLSK